MDMHYFVPHISWVRVTIASSSGLFSGSPVNHAFTGQGKGIQLCTPYSSSLHLWSDMEGIRLILLRRLSSILLPLETILHYNSRENLLLVCLGIRVSV